MGSTRTRVVALEDKHIVGLATDNQRGTVEAALGQLGAVEAEVGSTLLVEHKVGHKEGLERMDLVERNRLGKNNWSSLVPVLALAQSHMYTGHSTSKYSQLYFALGTDLAPSIGYSEGRNPETFGSSLVDPSYRCPAYSCYRIPPSHF